MGSSLQLGDQQLLMTKSNNSPPRPAQHARRFAHVRECQASALIEDYVEMIGDLIEINGEARVADIAARMGVAQPTATKAVARLKRQGLATSRPYRGIFLTEEGKQLADRVRSRHLIVVQFLVALGVPEEIAEIDGEGIEHHVSDQTLSAFGKYLAFIKSK
nr:manganese-binding transcriptional regulator MntR [Brucella anthropi]